MSILLVVIHVIVCIALIMIVLLQTGKGADMGAAFGGGSSQTLFGSSGASSFLSKATTVAAIVFMLTSLFLAYVSSNKAGSSAVLSDTPSSVTDKTAPDKTAPKTDETGTAAGTQDNAATPESRQQQSQEVPTGSETNPPVSSSGAPETEKGTGTPAAPPDAGTGTDSPTQN